MTNKELEAYAALILVETAQIDEPFSIDWLKDRPDLQIGSFGIEVTEAIDKVDGEQRSFDSEVLSQPRIEDACAYINDLKRPGEYRSSINQLPSSDIFTLERGGGYDLSRPIKSIVAAIERKSEKFYSYPEVERFYRRGLYVFDQELRPGLRHFDIETIINVVNDSAFDVVFIHQARKLIVIDKSNRHRQIHEHPLDPLMINDAKCEAKRIRKSPDYEDCLKRANAYRKLKESIVELLCSVQQYLSLEA